jgi:hypothetical protein
MLLANVTRATIEPALAGFVTIAAGFSLSAW